MRSEQDIIKAIFGLMQFDASMDEYLRSIGVDSKVFYAWLDKYKITYDVDKRFRLANFKLNGVAVNPDTLVSKLKKLPKYNSNKYSAGQIYQAIHRVVANGEPLRHQAAHGLSTSTISSWLKHYGIVFEVVQTYHLINFKIKGILKTPEEIRNEMEAMAKQPKQQSRNRYSKQETLEYVSDFLVENVSKKTSLPTYTKGNERVPSYMFFKVLFDKHDIAPITALNPTLTLNRIETGVEDILSYLVANIENDDETGYTRREYNDQLKVIEMLHNFLEANQKGKSKYIYCREETVIERTLNKYIINNNVNYIQYSMGTPKPNSFVGINNEKRSPIEVKYTLLKQYKAFLINEVTQYNFLVVNDGNNKNTITLL